MQEAATACRPEAEHPRKEHIRKRGTLAPCPLSPVLLFRPGLGESVACAHWMTDKLTKVLCVPAELTGKLPTGRGR